MLFSPSEKFLWYFFHRSNISSCGLIPSQLPPTPHFTADPVFAYKTFETHAALTGNATSQGYLAFFHATGYQNVVAVDQAKALLYYTFAAHGGDKASQMALGYRYWTGIGVVEDCERAVEWYGAAADQGKLGIPPCYHLLISEQRWHDSCPAHLGDAHFR